MAKSAQKNNKIEGKFIDLKDRSVEWIQFVYRFFVI